MCPVPQTNGHDCPGLLGEFVPGTAAMIEDVIVGREDPVGEPVVADKLPDVLDRRQLERSGRKGKRVMFSWIFRSLEPCQPVWSRMTTAWAHGLTAFEISARCKTWVLQRGSARPAPCPARGRWRRRDRPNGCADHTARLAECRARRGTMNGSVITNEGATAEITCHIGGFARRGATPSAGRQLPVQRQCERRRAHRFEPRAADHRQGPAS